MRMMKRKRLSAKSISSYYASHSGVDSTEASALVQPSML